MESHLWTASCNNELLEQLRAVQFPEKLIPRVISNALKGKQLPIYGDGRQIRDWLYVDDHARAILEVATRASKNQTYNIGGHNEKTNIEVVEVNL